VPPTLADRLVRILESIQYPGTWQENPETIFAKDLLLRLAVEKAFEIISERPDVFPMKSKRGKRKSIGKAWRRSATASVMPIIGWT
jgi:hypothetical protein